RLLAQHFRERFLHLQCVPGQYARARQNKPSKSPGLCACRLCGSNEWRLPCCEADEFEPAIRLAQSSSACSRCEIRCTGASVNLQLITIRFQRRRRAVPEENLLPVKRSRYCRRVYRDFEWPDRPSHLRPGTTSE